MEIGKETILGRLRDEGFSVMVVNRIDQLLGAFGNNIPQFCSLDKGKLTGAYNSISPEGEKGLGNKTWTAYGRFCAIYRESKYDAKQTAKAVVEEQERKEAEKAKLRQEILDRKVDFDTLTNAMAALGTLSIKECALGKLLEMYEMAKAAKGA